MSEIQIIRCIPPKVVPVSGDDWWGNYFVSIDGDLLAKEKLNLEESKRIGK